MSKTQFSRVLGNRETIALAFGAMIGWGWVVLAGDWIAEAGAIGAISAFLIGGALVTVIGFTYAELASAMPQAGGEHVYSQRALGKAGSFICTWAIVLGYVSVSAFEAVALPTVMDYLAPGFQHGYLWTVAGWDVYLSWVLIGSLGAVVITVVNILGVQPAARVQQVMLLLLFVGGLLLIVGAFGNGSGDNLQPLFDNGLPGIAAVVMMVPFMLVGFDVIPQAAEEINLPRKRIGTVLVVSVVMAVAWYVLIIIGAGLALNADQRGNADLVVAEAASGLWSGSWAGTLLVVAGIGGIITSWNAFVIGGSRAIYAMAHSGQLPAFLGRLHPRYHTPVNAIVLIGTLSALAPLLGRKALVWLVNAGGLGIVLAYGFVAVCFLVLRRREPQMERPFRAGRSTFAGWLALLASLALLVLYLPGSPSALVWPQEWAMITGWALLGVVLAALSRGQQKS
ncbi:APC family permease [Porticoccus sp. GXU_MW_L64]